MRWNIGIKHLRKRKINKMGQECENRIVKNLTTY